MKGRKGLYEYDSISPAVGNYGEAKKLPPILVRVKHGMSHATVQRLQRDMPVSTHTLNKLCEILHCSLGDVAEYVPDQKLMIEFCPAPVHFTGAVFVCVPEEILKRKPPNQGT